MDHEEKFVILRGAVGFLTDLEEQIDGIFGKGKDYEKTTWGQQERHRLCLDAVVRLRRQVGQLAAEIALGPVSDYTKPNPFPRQPKAREAG